MASLFPTYRTTGDRTRIDGVVASAFIHNGDYYLTDIGIYQDGMIDCWGLVDFEEFKQKVRSGWVVTQPPKKARISVSFLASFTAIHASYWIKPEEFIKEVADAIEELNGRPITSDRCREVWAMYEASPSEATAAELRLAYEEIPEHNRMYVLLDQDAKDHPIRAVLYPHEYEREE
jgi:hypothetical protein